MRKPTSILYPDLLPPKSEGASAYVRKIVNEAGADYCPQYETEREPNTHLKVYCDGYSILYPDLYSPHGNTKRGKGGYDRKNAISQRGYQLRGAAKRKIISTLFYRFYKTRQNKYNRLKFFTFTIQESAYREIESAGEGLLSGKERTALADNYFIRALSKCLETKSKTDPLKGGRLDAYVWVAEKTKRGVIHFHCVLETAYLDVRALSSYWAKLCGMEDFRNSVHFGFEERGRFKQKRIRNPKALARYLTKYISKGATTDKDGKNVKDWKIYGRAYGMSRNYSAAYKESYVVIPNFDYSEKDFDNIYKAKPGGVWSFSDKYGKSFEFSIHYQDYYSCLKGYFPQLYKFSGHRVLGNQQKIPILLE